MGSFQKSLQRLMDEQGVTAAKLSKETRIPKSTISEWLRGRQPKFDETILRLAKFLQVSPEDLLTGEKSKELSKVEISASDDDGYVAIHDGIFRLKIEKYIGKKK
jgi:transcriptional regulator with XRE-family HTH domain